MAAIALELSNYKGELAALAGAFLWAAASVVYGRLGVRIPPLQLNFLKGAIALFFLAVTFAFSGGFLPQFPPLPVAMLLLSGAIGIGLGDTAYFAALNALGARRTLLFETLAPPLAAILASLFLAEFLSAFAWSGILLVATGVAWVASERTAQTPSDRLFIGQGLAWAGLAELSQASGAVLSRAALSESPIPPLWSAFFRITAGTVCALLLLLARPSAPLLPERSLRQFSIIVVTAFLGTYVAIWLQQTALKFSPTGIAQTLSATSPLFVLPMVAALGEKVSWRAVGGVAIALLGIALLLK